MITKCWWCGNNADSREHIIKKSDIKRVYGKNQIDARITRMGKSVPVQGPNSTFVKFNANLCSRCNNDRSSEFDKAYDQFIEWSHKNYSFVLDKEQNKRQKVFHENTEDKLDKVLKYYIKHIGCRLSHSGFKVPSDIMEYLNGQSELRSVKLMFEARTINLNHDLVSSQGRSRPFQTLGFGDLHTINSKEGVSAVFSWYTTGWVSLNYIVRSEICKSNQADHICKFGIKFYKNTSTPKEESWIKTRADLADFVDIHDRTGSVDKLKNYYRRILNAE